jgi:hypothetical protein
MCPVNGKEYAAVSSKTIKHHVRKPWRRLQKNQGYYFCSDPKCNVVYFGEDGSVLEKSAIRTRVGIKEESEGSMLCYCFGATVGEARANPAVKAFVIEETRRNECACETRNPSGKCCLGEFPKSGKR